jgi:Ser-tRNA(Ala) deacylase AlaX
MTIAKTAREYFKNTFLFESTAKVLDCKADYLVLDRTIFHPQGIWY